MRNWMIGTLASLALLGAAERGEAAVYMAYQGVAIGDTDGVIGLGDLDTTRNGPFTLEIRSDGTEQTGTFGFRVGITDEIELVTISEPTLFATTSYLFGGDLNRVLSYTGGGLGAGALLATFSLDVGLLGNRPDDDLRDLSLRIYEDDAIFAAGIIDPITGDLTDRAFIDVQAVPLPAGAVLLASAIGLLRLRRRF